MSISLFVEHALTIKILMHNSYETILFVDLVALEHNYHYLKSKLNPGTEIIAVVKAFAYGHGDIKVAKK